MPNWCNNKLTVIGDHKRVMDFMQKARGPRPYYALSDYQIQWEKQRKEEEGDSYVSPEQRCLNDIEDFSFHQLVPIPDEILKKGYDPYGYKEERELWGIKWGGSQSVLSSYKEGIAHYEYDTPLAPGGLFLLTLSTKWTDLLFALSFKEEYPTRGRFLLKNGSFLEEIYEEPPSKRGRAWDSFYYRTHNKWVKSLKP